MSMKTKLGLAALAVVALLVAGIAYWALRENSLGPVRFGRRAPGCSAGHCSACAPGLSISFDGATEPSHGAARSGFSSTFDGATTESSLDAASAAPAAPSSPAAIAQSNQPPASPATPPHPTGKRRTRAATASPNTRSPDDNAAC